MALGIFIGERSSDKAIAVNGAATTEDGRSGRSSEQQAQVIPVNHNRNAGKMTAKVSQNSSGSVSTKPVATRTGTDAAAIRLIDERIEKTRQWLSTAVDTHYSIQLFTARTSDADRVEAFLKASPETLDFEKIFIYETVINGRAWFSVMYNDFATQDEAIETLEQLPSSLKASDPYLRRIYALKKDSTRK
jgi:DamX protein